MITTSSPRRRRSLSRALLVATVLVILIIAVQLIRLEHAASASHLDVMRARLQALGHPVPAIVLGMGPGPTQPILDRAELAAELWKTGAVSYVVTSGGQGADEPEPESRTLRRALDNLGIPASAIREESASTSTRENLRFSRTVMEANGGVPRPYLIVTHDFHALRAGELARHQGDEAIVIGIRGARLNGRAPRLLREVAALLRLELFGR